jgi:hypothetical protein
MKDTKLFVLEIRDVIADFENDRIDSTELCDQIQSLIEYHEG